MPRSRSSSIRGCTRAVTSARRCRFCSYRSLCNRGVEAGRLDEAGADDAAAEPDFDWNAGFDFEQIAEIAF